jgi:hypothetical protein
LPTSDLRPRPGAHDQNQKPPTTDNAFSKIEPPAFCPPELTQKWRAKAKNFDQLQKSRIILNRFCYTCI